MIKTRIGVYARLKPKQSPKDKTIYEIAKASSDSGQSVAKLTLTKRGSEAKLANTKEKPKSTLNPQPTASNSKRYSMKRSARPTSSRRSGRPLWTAACRASTARVGPNCSLRLRPNRLRQNVLDLRTRELGKAGNHSEDSVVPVRPEGEAVRQIPHQSVRVLFGNLQRKRLRSAERGESGQAAQEVGQGQLFLRRGGRAGGLTTGEQAADEGPFEARVQLGAARSGLPADGELPAPSGLHADEQHVESVALSLHPLLRNRGPAHGDQVLLEAQPG